jgi:putative endonuclease
MDESRTAALGRYGEQLAAEHLTAAGMTVLARNWRCPQASSTSSCVTPTARSSSAR